MAGEGGCSDPAETFLWDEMDQGSGRLSHTQMEARGGCQSFAEAAMHIGKNRMGASLWLGTRFTVSMDSRFCRAPRYTLASFPSLLQHYIAFN